MRLVFAQYDTQPRSASGEVYEALDGTPRFLVCSDSDEVASDAVAVYACDELSDTGPAEEPTGVLSVVAFAAPEGQFADFERWYAEEHIGLLMRADGWLRARRYRVRSVAGGMPWTHIALHDLRDQAVLDSPERAAARSTQWRARFAEQEWFEQAGRWLYRPLIDSKFAVRQLWN